MNKLNSIFSFKLKQYKNLILIKIKIFQFLQKLQFQVNRPTKLTTDKIKIISPK